MDGRTNPAITSGSCLFSRDGNARRNMSAPAINNLFSFLQLEATHGLLGLVAFLRRFYQVSIHANLLQCNTQNVVSQTFQYHHVIYLKTGKCSFTEIDPERSLRDC